MAGPGVGISDELISLQITSANVPDLTLIDLPGIARVAVKGQPENIGDQVNFSFMTFCMKKIVIVWHKILNLHQSNAFLLD